MDQMTVTSLLSALGSTPDEVASTFKSHGIQGVRNTARFLNPLVRYLQTQLPDAPQIDVFQMDRVRLAFDGDNIVEAILPEPVQLFLNAFNNGDYPEIVGTVNGSQ
jgi:hypothetical protein